MENICSIELVNNNAGKKVHQQNAASFSHPHYFIHAITKDSDQQKDQTRHNVITLMGLTCAEAYSFSQAIKPSWQSSRSLKQESVLTVNDWSPCGRHALERAWYYESNESFS